MAKHFRGTVERLYVNMLGCGIRLDPLGNEEQSDEEQWPNYFWLYHTDGEVQGEQVRAHPGYASSYALLLAAAINRYSVILRLQTNTEDQVQYVVVDW